MSEQDYDADDYGAGIAALIIEELMERYEVDTLVIELPDTEYDLEVRKVTTEQEQRLDLDGGVADAD